MRFVGWDWASTSHDVTVLDEQGRVVERWGLRHTEQGLGQALARLAGHGQPVELPVIIERSAGLVVAGCWPPAIRSSRSIPPPSMPPGLAGALPVPSPILVT